MIQDLETNIEQEFMPAAGSAIWSPGGEMIYFSLLVDGNPEIYRRNADLSGASESIVVGPGVQWPRTISPDGEWLIYAEAPGGGFGSSNRFWITSLTEDGEPRRLFDGEGHEQSIAFSPNGRWLAWSTDKFGSDEVYVSSFPNLRGSRQVSRGGGKDVAWSADGSTLYFARGDSQVFAVDFTSADEFSSQTPVMGAVAPTMDGGNFALADSGDRPPHVRAAQRRRGGPHGAHEGGGELVRGDPRPVRRALTSRAPTGARSSDR